MSNTVIGNTQETMSILYDCFYTCTNVQEKLTEIGGFLMLRQENNL